MVSLQPAPTGRDVDPAALETIQKLLGDAPRRPDLLIEHLHRIQDTYGCIAVAHLTALAAEMRLALAEVYEVATFYPHFDIVRDGETPPPRLTIRVCDSVSCHLAGSARLLTMLQGSARGGVRVVTTPCIGRCDRAPVAVVGRNPIDHATAETVRDAAVAKRTAPEIPSYIAYDDYCRSGGYEILRGCHGGQRNVDDVLRTIDASGLRGLGGTGFPVAQKWKDVRAEPAPRVIAVSANEGEPGTFKDRHCIETDPHRVLEGALIAAWFTDAEDLFIYLRDEYTASRAILTREIAALAASPPCRLPRIHLRRGAGAYVCGEESALVESIEGRRGQPRSAPPFPAQVGVFGRPTLVQNVETLYWLRAIIEDGAAAWRGLGRPDHPGARFFSVSGRVQKPGVYLAPNGVTARELIQYAGGMAEGHELYGYLPGGASGGILPASMADLPLDFGSLDQQGCSIGAAAVVVLSQRDKARDVARNLMQFFADESCGKCTPCRVGTAKASALMADGSWQLPLLNDLADVMHDASICGLGRNAPNALRCVQKHFRKEMSDLIDLGSMRGR